MKVALLGALAVIPALALAGCVTVHSSDPCGALTLLQVTPPAHVADKWAFSVSFRNCSSQTLLLTPLDCGRTEGFQVTLHSPGGDRWRLRDGLGAGPAQAPDAELCWEGLNATRVVAGSEFGRLFLWDGTLAGAAQPPHGPYRVEALVRASTGKQWSANHTFETPGGHASGERCGRVILAPSPTVIKPGEEVQIPVRFLNCGGVPLLIHPAGCTHFPAVEVENPAADRAAGERGWRVGQGSAERSYCFADGQQTVLPGAEIGLQFMWNGTFRDGGNVTPAAPGWWDLRGWVQGSHEVFEGRSQVYVADQGGLVHFRDLTRGGSSGLSAKVFTVINNSEEWGRFWERHLSNRHCAAPGDRSCLPPAPAVDFDRELVVATWAGDRPSGCHALRILQIVEEGGATRVFVEHRTPSASTFCTAVITQPHAAVAIPRGGPPVEFVEETVEASS